MPPEDLKYWIAIIGQFGVAPAVAAGVVFLLLKNYATKYLQEKGKNLATLEDIAEITRRTETVKTEFSSQERLRFAAMERRLQAHQEAYGLARRLAADTQNRGEDRLAATVAECSIWFNANALYLEPDARHAFFRASHAASTHKNYEPGPNWNGEDRSVNWKKIAEAEDIIARCVGLPPLSSAEAALPPWDLTLPSSGLAPAAQAWPSFHSGPSPRRLREPLMSNVRPHMKTAIHCALSPCMVAPGSPTLFASRCLPARNPSRLYPAASSNSCKLTRRLFRRSDSLSPRCRSQAEGGYLLCQLVVRASRGLNSQFVVGAPRRSAWQSVCWCCRVRQHRPPLLLLFAHALEGSVPRISMQGILPTREA